MKSSIPTYHLEEINDQNQSLKEVFYSDEKLFALRNMLNNPYRSNYYGLGLCVSGSANLIGNLDSYLVQPYSIVAMSPQVIKQWKNVSEDFETLTIFFTKTFFTKIFANKNYLEQFQFLVLYEITCKLGFSKANRIIFLNVRLYLNPRAIRLIV